MCTIFLLNKWIFMVAILDKSARLKIRMAVTKQDQKDINNHNNENNPNDVNNLKNMKNVNNTENDIYLSQRPTEAGRHV